MAWALAADAVLFLHLCVVAFVVLGLGLIVLGNLRGWCYVNAWWFRLVHLLTIGVVVVQSWLGKLCPLTTLELWLRERAGEASYNGGFIEYWLSRLLYVEAPPWAFVLAYTVFGLCVVAAWGQWPPRRPGASAGRSV
ncbi:DUF2784 domain-containing protein [Aquimonas voraii]|uniref:DUF2784 domain-containing protein n=1 Tax=Aquimonas voraii TaxID=265719 RepID=A0A1G6UUJ5_9GAMM|nr:DUF2784 domain-containing protein [Aquimonas voraii]SDD44924.1 Protein of Unknown function [Aquimonas voraii]